MAEADPRLQRPVEPSMTLTLTHEQAVVLAAAAIHFQGWCMYHDEAMVAAIAGLEEVSDLILKHPQLSEVSHATLQDMRYQLIERGDEPQGGDQQHAASP